MQGKKISELTQYDQTDLTVIEVPAVNTDDGENYKVNLGVINTLDTNKADKSTTYTKTQVDASLATKADKDSTYTKTEVDTSLATKADKSDTYTKAQVDNALDDKVGIGDYDPSLRAGVADTAYDVIADNTDTETFTSRVVGNTASGHAITKGNASVKVMKGNSVVWNQLVKNLLSNDSYIKDGITYTKNTNGTITANGTASGNTSINSVSFQSEAGHKYLFRCISGGSDSSFYVTALESSQTGYRMTNPSIYTPSSSFSIAMYLNFVSGVSVNNLLITPMIIDLTKMFNGDTTIIGKIENASDKYAEFLKYAPIVADQYAYNEGTLISNNATAIRSKDTNGAVLATRPTLIKSIKDAQGNVVFPNGLLKAGSVADSIDYRAGKAVKRVGKLVLTNDILSRLQRNQARQFIIRSVASGNTSSNGVTDTSYSYRQSAYSNVANSICIRSYQLWVSNDTDDIDDVKSKLLGKTIFYELGTPEEYTFEPSHLDYPIVNGGVEELVAEGNVAPIVADITYPCSQNGTIDAILERVGSMEDASGKIQSLDQAMQGFVCALALSWNTTTDKIGVLDMGELYWSYQYGLFLYSLVEGEPIGSAGTKGKIATTEYPTYSYQEKVDKTISLTTSTNVAVKDSSYTDATIFKNAMAGIYLFYKKA